MDEKPDEIMNHIESQRDKLGRNLSELESRVKRSTDWRAQFDRNPMLLMGVALGGGLLLGSIVGSSRDRSSKTSWSSSPRGYSASSSSLGATSGYATSPSTPSSPTTRQMGEQRRKSTDTLEHMKAALIGFATAKVKEFMSEALPGFNQHLEEAQQRRSSSHDPFAEHNPSYPGGGSYPSGSETGSQQGNSPTGTTRTEQSFNSPYKQEPVGANPSRNG